MRFLFVVAITGTGVCAGQWTPSIGLGNPTIIWKLQACENRVYAATPVDEIYYSDNEGKTWSAFNYQKYEFKAFLASGHNKYMLQGDSLLCSACKDTNWTTILKIPSVKEVFISGESIYFLKNDTFFVSNLDGTGLKPISPKLPFPIIKSAISGQTIYVVNESWDDSSGTEHEENLHRFGPNDQSWVQLTRRSSPDDIKAMAVAGGRVFAGTMHGLYVWSDADSALLPLSNNKWVDDLFPAFGKLLVAPWDPITLDTAAIASAGIPPDLIVPDKLDEEIIMTTAGDSTLYILNRTVNVGAHEAYYFHYDGTSFGNRKSLFWNQVMGPGTPVDGLVFDGQTLWGYSKSNGLFRSDDIGKSWGLAGYARPWDLRAFSKLGARLCAVTAEYVSLTSDTGVDWTVVDLGNADPARTLLDAFVSGSDAFITSTNGFFRTRDAGRTWTVIDQKADRLNSCAMHGKDILFFTTDSIRRIAHSPDDGVTWETACQSDSEGESYSNITSHAAGALVYSTTRGILYSGDGGATWKSRNTGIADSLNINSLLCCQNTLLASTRVDSSWGGGWRAVRGDLFIWSDSLNSWVKKSIGKEALSTVSMRQVGPYVYAYAWASGQYNEMFLSSNGGGTWESLGAISYYDTHRQFSYAFTNNEFFVGCNGGLWRHPIANPVSYYTGLAPRHPVARVCPASAITCALSGRTLRFKIPAGFGGAPSLTLISISGRKIADLKPAIFDNAAGTAVFRLGNIASGALLYRIVFKDTVKKGMLIVPSLSE